MGFPTFLQNAHPPSRSQTATNAGVRPEGGMVVKEAGSYAANPKI